MGSLTPAVAWSSQRQRNWPQGNTSPSTLSPTTAQIGTTVLNTHINLTSYNAQYVWVSCISLLGVAVWHSVFIDWEILEALHALWLYDTLCIVLTVWPTTSWWSWPIRLVVGTTFVLTMQRHSSLGISCPSTVMEMWVDVASEKRKCVSSYFITVLFNHGLAHDFNLWLLK